MVRFAVIGTSQITRRFLQSAALHPDFKLTAVYSRSLEKAAEFAAPYGVQTLYDDPDALAQSREVDAVYIASPNAFHCEQALRMLSGKKHVLCEKPIASNSGELAQMMQAAQQNGVILMEAMKSTAMPNFKVLEQNLPRVGKIRRMVSVYCQYSSRYDAFKQGTVLNAFKPELSNGALMDIGVYCVHPVVRLLGEPDRITASAEMLPSGVDGAGSITAIYKEGMQASLLYSKIADSFLPSEIQGEDGTLVVDSIHTPTRVTFIPRGGAAQDLSVPQSDEQMLYELQDFIALVKDNPPHQAHLADSVRSMRVMDEARTQIGLVYPADEK